MRSEVAVSLLLVSACAACPAKGQDMGAPAGVAPIDSLVEVALERGSAWLLELQERTCDRLTRRREPSPLQEMEAGELAFFAFALLRAGVPPARLEPTFAWLKQHPLRETYALGLYALALGARSTTRLGPEERRSAGVSYVRGPVPRPDLEEIERAVRRLLSGKIEKGRWSYHCVTEGQSGPLIGENYDNSNTQVAVYGVDAAVHAGVRVDPRLLVELLEHWLREQDPRSDEVDVAGTEVVAGSPLAGWLGERPSVTSTRARSSVPTWITSARGWAYLRTGRLAVHGPEDWVTPSLSMTAAGVSSIAMLLRALERTHADVPAWLREEATNAIRAGLAWLAVHWDPTAFDRWDPTAFDRGRGNGTYYTAWSLEKAMSTVGVRRLAGRDWWSEAARTVAAAQNANGSWGGPRPDALGDPRETAFALLVLTRSSLSGWSPDVSTADEAPAVRPRAPAA